MRFFTVIACLLFSLSTSATEYELIILAGQSNAQGWKGDAAKYQKNEKADAQIPMWAVFPDKKEVHRTDGWTTLGPQAGRFKTGHFGPDHLTPEPFGPRAIEPTSHLTNDHMTPKIQNIPQEM